MQKNCASDGKPVAQDADVDERVSKTSKMAVAFSSKGVCRQWWQMVNGMAIAVVIDRDIIFSFPQDVMARLTT